MRLHPRESDTRQRVWYFIAGWLLMLAGLRLGVHHGWWFVMFGLFAVGALLVASATIPMSDWGDDDE